MTPAPAIAVVISGLPRTPHLSLISPDKSMLEKMIPEAASECEVSESWERKE
jgi:hypothetical protein